MFKKMLFLFVFENGFSGSMEKFLARMNRPREYKISKSLQKKGHTVFWLMTEFGNEYKIKESFCDEIRIISITFPSFLSGLTAVFKTIIHLRPNVFFCRPFILKLDHLLLPIMLYRIIFRNELVFHIFDLPVDISISYGRLKKGSLQEKKLRIKETFTYMMSTKVIVLNQHIKRLLQIKHTNPKKMLIAGAGSDPDHFNPNSISKLEARGKLGIPTDKMVVGWFGHMSPQKALSTQLLPSIEIITNNSQNFFFLIGGDGIDRKKIELATKKINPESIRLLGWVSYSEIPFHYAACDITVNTLKRGLEQVEAATPAKIFDSLMMGIPVVTVETTAMKEIFEDRKHVYFIKKDDPQSLADGIIDLVRNDDLMNELRIQGQKYVRTNFNLKSDCEKIADFISSASEHSNQFHNTE